MLTFKEEYFMQYNHILTREAIHDMTFKTRDYAKEKNLKLLTRKLTHFKFNEKHEEYLDDMGIDTSGKVLIFDNSMNYKNSVCVYGWCWFSRKYLPNSLRGKSKIETIYDAAYVIELLQEERKLVEEKIKEEIETAKREKEEEELREKERKEYKERGSKLLNNIHDPIFHILPSVFDAERKKNYFAPIKVNGTLKRWVKEKTPLYRKWLDPNRPYIYYEKVGGKCIRLYHEDVSTIAHMFNEKAYNYALNELKEDDPLRDTILDYYESKKPVQLISIEDGNSLLGINYKIAKINIYEKKYKDIPIPLDFLDECDLIESYPDELTLEEKKEYASLMSIHLDEQED